MPRASCVRIAMDGLARVEGRGCEAGLYNGKDTLEVATWSRISHGFPSRMYGPSTFILLLSWVWQSRAARGRVREAHQTTHNTAPAKYQAPSAGPSATREPATRGVLLGRGERASGCKRVLKAAAWLLSSGMGMLQLVGSLSAACRQRAMAMAMAGMVAWWHGGMVRSGARVSFSHPARLQYTYARIMHIAIYAIVLSRAWSLQVATDTSLLLRQA